MIQKLNCLSEKTANELFENVQANIDRYKNGNFEDQSDQYGWSVELQTNVDLEPLKDLEGTSGQESEVKNALLVWESFKQLTPGMACENRIWTRITHLEGLKYSRQRWLISDSDETIIKSVKDHFFADTRTKWRDDNAISRLWWVAYVANLALPGNQKQALQLILSKADIRSNFIERPRISSRPKIAAGILRAMIANSWIIDKEVSYRTFMKELNKYGGGLLFESWSDTDIDSFMTQCAIKAKAA
jgi:hypothetical protein